MKTDRRPSFDKVKVAILEDHQGIIDGYRYRLSQSPHVEVVGIAYCGSALEPLLQAGRVDVLFLDIHVPTAPDNPTPYPILHLIPDLLNRYPDLAVLVVSMLAEQGLIQAVMNAGASGYVLKDDRQAIEQLGSIVMLVHQGGIYLSENANQQILKRGTSHSEPLLSPRQTEALSLCAAHPGWTRAELAVGLGVSHSTARNLLSHAYMRLGVSNLTAALEKARQLRLITPLPSDVLG